MTRTRVQGMGTSQANGGTAAAAAVTLLCIAEGAFLSFGAKGCPFPRWCLCYAVHNKHDAAPTPAPRPLTTPAVSCSGSGGGCCLGPPSLHKTPAHGSKLPCCLTPETVHEANGGQCCWKAHSRGDCRSATRWLCAAANALCPASSLQRQVQQQGDELHSSTPV